MELDVTESTGQSLGATGLGSETNTVTEPTMSEPAIDMSNIPEWAQKLEVDRDILQDPSLKAINDINSLAKSYVHAQRKIGQKGVLLPNENSTKEEWDTFYQKTGVPLEEQNYVNSLEFPSQEESFLPQQFNEEFAKKAHELRIRPDQANQMYKFFSDITKNTNDSYMAEMQEKKQEKLNALMNTLGEDAYNVKLNKASQLINEQLGSEFSQYLESSGLGNDARIVEAFMKLADNYYKEDAIPRDSTRTALTKDQINQEINLAMGNFDDPYHRPDHPDHKRRVNEIQSYFAKLEK